MFCFVLEIYKFLGSFYWHEGVVFSLAIYMDRFILVNKLQEIKVLKIGWAKLG